jgi:hypothetical protein
MTQNDEAYYFKRGYELARIGIITGGDEAFSKRQIRAFSAGQKFAQMEVAPWELMSTFIWGQEKPDNREFWNLKRINRLRCLFAPVKEVSC